MATPKNFKVKKDGLPTLAKSLAILAEQRVMVGIPSTTAGRQDDEEEEKHPLNNAEIMFIHENGAPDANIPARPVVHPAIRSVQGQIVAGLTQGGQAAMNNQAGRVIQIYNAVGLIVQNAMRNRIREGLSPPLSPKTIAQRARKRGTKRRAGEEKYLDLVKGGMSPADAQVATGIKPLWDTGQLLRALTYVIRKVRWRK